MILDFARTLPLMLLLCAGICAAAPRPATKPADDSDWGPAGLRAGGGTDANWGPETLTIPIEQNSDVTFGPEKSNVMVIGRRVWDLAAGKPTGVEVGEYGRRSLRAISNDGKLFAACFDSPNVPNTSVAVWSTETGKKVSEFLNPGQDTYVDVLQFAGPTQLVIAGRLTGGAVWDAQTGKLARKFFKLPACNQHTTSISPDGRYMAFVHQDHVYLYDVRTGQQVFTLTNPTGFAAGPGAPAHPAADKSHTPNHPQVAGSKREKPPFNPIFLYAWAEGFQFSGDGKELAGLFLEQGLYRLIVWDRRGGIVFDATLPQAEFRGPEPGKLTWLPDSSGWLVDGCVLFDRKAKRAVMRIPTGFGSEIIHHFVDREHLLMAHGHESGPATSMGIVTIPWTKIAASTDAIARKAPALLAPGQSVSIVFDLANARGDVTEAKETVTSALTDRLARDGISVADNAPLVFTLTMTEAAGERRKIVERANPFDIRGRDTGQTAVDANGSLVMVLSSRAGGEALWEERLEAGSNTTFKEEINDATIRKSMLERLGSQVSSLRIPYYIPVDKNLISLPVYLD